MLKIGSLFLAAVVLTSACARSASEDLIFVAGHDLRGIARASDAIVVGVVLGEGGTRDLARDPRDITREHPTLAILGQDYRVAVETSLKGNVGTDLTVTVARFYRDRGSEQKPAEHFIPLKVGARYLLFAQELRHAPGVYSIAFEPSRFSLGATAVVQSPWTDAPKFFPESEAGAFVRQVRDAIATTSSR